MKVERFLTPCADPLREKKNLSGLKFYGYTQTIKIEGKGCCAEPWSLLQVVPEGRIYIPMYNPTADVDYYEPAAPFETVGEKNVTLVATGKNRYKVGYKAADVTGRIGYFCSWDSQSCLIIRNFPNDPSGRYEEEPPLIPGEKGFSIHIYNDSGEISGFAELECSMPAVGSEGQRSEAIDRIDTWIIKGNAEEIAAAAEILVGGKT